MDEFHGNTDVETSEPSEHTSTSLNSSLSHVLMTVTLRMHGAFL